MEPRDRKKITLAIDELVENVDMVKLYPKLFERSIFYEDDPSAPKWKLNLCDPTIKKDILLEIRTRGPHAYQNFVRCLEDINQSHLIDVLEDRNRSGGENNSNVCNVINNEENNSSKIKVIKSTSFYERSNTELYVMQSKPRGLVLIINLIHYAQSGNIRNAADQDEINLKDLFEQMGFTVFTAGDDLTVEGMRREIEMFSQNPQFRHVDSSFVIISGHGNNSHGESVICGIDHPGTDNECPEKELRYGEILEYFSAKKCPLLINKPKVFIFQACRGTREQKTTAYKGDDNRYIPINFNSSNTTVPIQCGISGRNYEDIFIAHATLPDQVAYRDNKDGSWLHQGICKVFAEKAHNLHLSELFTAVDKHVSSMRTNDESCQTVTTKEIGVKHVCYINPGYFNDNS